MDKKALLTLGVIILLLLSVSSVIGGTASRISETNNHKTEKFPDDIITDIELLPDKDVYTQGQMIKIKVESSSDENLDVSIHEYFNETQGNAVKIWDSQKISEIWTKNYTIPNHLQDGSYRVTVKENKTNKILDSKVFELKKYELKAAADKNSYIPGEKVDVYYTISKILDGSSSKGFEVGFQVKYDPKGALEQKKMSGRGKDGHFSFEIPMNITKVSRMEIKVTGNKNGEYKVSWSGSIDVNDLKIGMDIGGEKFLPGEIVYVTAETFVKPIYGLGYRSSVENAQITVLLEDPDGNKIKGTIGEGSTDDSGKVIVPIQIPEDIKIGTYRLNLTAEKNGLQTRVKRAISIMDEKPEFSLRIDSKKYPYSPGERVNLSCAVTRKGESLEANIRFIVSREAPHKIYEMGFAKNGHIKFRIPDDFNPDDKLLLDIKAVVDENNKTSTKVTIPITGTQLLLNSDQNEYLSGDVIDLKYEVIGEEKLKSVRYQIIDDKGKTIKKGRLEDNIFRFKVPAFPSKTYEVKITAVTEKGRIIEEKLSLQQKTGYRLELDILTDSDYTTEIYRPGQEIKVHYALRARGEEDIPEKISIKYSFLSTGSVKKIQTDKPEGTFTVKLPERSDGTYHLQVTSEGRANLESVKVSDDTSVFNLKTIGGLSLSNLLEIVLIASVIIIAGGFLFFTRTNKGPRGSKREEAEEGEEKEGLEEKEIEEKSAPKKKTSPKEEAHGWKGPEEKEEGRIDEIESEDEDQIEPDEPDW